MCGVSKKGSSCSHISLREQTKPNSRHSRARFRGAALEEGNPGFRPTPGTDHPPLSSQSIASSKDGAMRSITVPRSDVALPRGTLNWTYVLVLWIHQLTLSHVNVICTRISIRGSKWGLKLEILTQTFRHHLYAIYYIGSKKLRQPSTTQPTSFSSILSFF